MKFSWILVLHFCTCCFEFNNTPTICDQTFRYFTDLLIMKQGYSVQIFNEFGLSINEKIFSKRFIFSGTPDIYKSFLFFVLKGNY